LRVSKAVRLYIAHKRSMGWAFTTIEPFLVSFARYIGDVHLRSITTTQVSNFLDGRAGNCECRRLNRATNCYRPYGRLSSLTRGLTKSLSLDTDSI
jgi:hypothetical protein